VLLAFVGLHDCIDRTRRVAQGSRRRRRNAPAIRMRPRGRPLCPFYRDATDMCRFRRSADRLVACLRSCDRSKRGVHIDRPSRRLCAAVDTTQRGAARLEMPEEIVPTPAASDLTQARPRSTDEPRRWPRRRPLVPIECRISSSNHVRRPPCRLASPRPTPRRCRLSRRMASAPNGRRSGGGQRPPAGTSANACRVFPHGAG
jgi:hypothetical protein